MASIRIGLERDKDRKTNNNTGPLLGLENTQQSFLIFLHFIIYFLLHFYVSQQIARTLSTLIRIGCVTQ